LFICGSDIILYISFVMNKLDKFNDE